MPNYRSLCPGRFLRGVDLHGPTTIMILGFRREELKGAGKDDEEGNGQKGKEPKRKGGRADEKTILIAKMKNLETGHVCPSGKNCPNCVEEIVWNFTNNTLTAAIHGEDWALWIGKPITLHFDPSVKLCGQDTGGIRVCGSPSLKSPISVKVKMPCRKVADIYRLTPTAAPSARAESPTAPAAEPSTPPDTAE